MFRRNNVFSVLLIPRVFNQTFISKRCCHFHLINDQKRTYKGENVDEPIRYCFGL